MDSKSKNYTKKFTELEIPTLHILADRIKDYQGEAYLQVVEDNIEIILNHIINLHDDKIRDICALACILQFAIHREIIWNSLKKYLQNPVKKLKKNKSESEKKFFGCQIDCCLYLTFELAAKHELERVASECSMAINALLLKRIQAPIFSSGLRQSFLKAMEMAKYLPSLINLMEITDSEESRAFLFIFHLLQQRQDGKFNTTLMHLKKIYNLPKKSLVFLAKDLRRFVPYQYRYRRSPRLLSLDSLFSTNADCELSLAKLLILYYANHLDPAALCYASNHKTQLGISKQHVDILSALSGYDIPYILSLNKALFTAGLRNKILPPSLHSTVIDYMSASLTSWVRHRYFNKSKSLSAPFPLISVIFTTLNPNLTLFKLAFDSIIYQTYPSVEIIVIDDHSPMELSHKLEAMLIEARNITSHPIIYQRNKKNLGQYISRNIAIKMSKGEFIAIQDDDDISFLERLQYQLEPMLANNIVMATHVKHIRISEISNLMMDGDDLDEVLGNAPVSFMWRKCVFADIGYFLPTKTRGDIEFRSRMRRFYSENAIKTISLPLLIMRGGLSTISSEKEYYYRSALNGLRYMINYIPLGTDGEDLSERWIPMLLR